jgi:hypothetical protein
MNPKSQLSFRCLTALALGTLLAACGGGEDIGGGTSSSSPTFTSSAGNSSSGSCYYADLISDSERAKANACGPQGSSNFAAADSGLQSVISACKVGEVAKADAYYAGTYKKMVTYARDVYSTVCR